MNQTFAFGERAQAYAARMHADSPTLIFEPEHALDAQQCAVDLKCRFGGFDVITILDDARTTTGAFMARHIANRFTTYDERRAALDTLSRNALIVNGQPQSEFTDVDQAVLSTMRDVAVLAQTWIVRSWLEYYRLAERFDHHPANVHRCLEPSPLPEFAKSEHGDGSILVWAPFQAASSLFTVVMALEETRCPVFVVCRGRLAPGLRARQLSHAEGLRKIAAVQLVVAAATDDPGDALALLARGIRVVAPRTSGVREYSPGCEIYEPWNRRDIFDAVVRALGKAAGDTLQAPASAAQEVSETALPDPPFVSVIVRTFNREALLERALASLASQTFKNFEAVVVNNGGRKVSKIVEKFGFARAVDTEASPIWRAANAGLEKARGTYVALLDDDDAFFPDHLERMVRALERSGAAAAHADALNVYVKSAKGQYAVEGYAAVTVPAALPSLMLSRCLMVGSSRVVFRRSALGDGGFIERLPVAGDYELWLRLQTASDFVQVNAVTSMYTQFSDRSNVSVSRGVLYCEAHRLIFALHPVAGRPALEAERQSVLRFLQTEGGLGMTPPRIPLVTPIPLPGYT